MEQNTNTTESVKVLSDETGSIPCKGQNRATLNRRHLVLTGHHENCPDGKSEIEALRELAGQLIAGLEAFGADCDGIHPEAWDAYKRGKFALEGVIVPDEEEG